MMKKPVRTAGVAGAGPGDKAAASAGAGKRYRGVFAALLSLALVLGTVAGPFLPWAQAARASTCLAEAMYDVVIPDREFNTFRDVGPDHWANEFVEAVNALGLMNGVSADAYGRWFAPGDPLTRAQAVVVAGRLSNDNDSISLDVFHAGSTEAYCDLVAEESGKWYSADAKEMLSVARRNDSVGFADLGFTEIVAEERNMGFTWAKNGEDSQPFTVTYRLYSFAPTATATRADFALFLWARNGCPTVDEAAPDGETETSADVQAAGIHFTDETEMTPAALAAAKWLASYGAISGYADGAFHGERGLTRAAAAKIVASLYLEQQSYGCIRRESNVMGDTRVTLLRWAAEPDNTMRLPAPAILERWADWLAALEAADEAAA